MTRVRADEVSDPRKHSSDTMVAERPYRGERHDLPKYAADAATPDGKEVCK